MWPFSKKPKTASIYEHPRYAKQPLNLLVEAFVLDVIGHLPDAKRQTLQAMNLQKVFNTQASEWRAVLCETLHLSDTIEVAILDLWYLNQSALRQQGQNYEPVAFSQDFADNYFAEGSQVDVWPEGALDAAKKRIAQYRPVEPNQGVVSRRFMPANRQLHLTGPALRLSDDITLLAARFDQLLRSFGHRPRWCNVYASFNAYT